MWKRKELKSKAKKIVSRNYWTAIVVCFLIALFTGEFGTSILGVLNSNDSIDPNYIEHEQIIKNKLQESTNIIPKDKFFKNNEHVKKALNQTQIKLIDAVEKNINSATKSQKYILKIWDAIALFNKNDLKRGVALSVGALLAFLFIVIVADPLIVGGKKYFLKAIETEENTKISVVAEIFKKENWPNVILIMFLKNIYNALWYLTIIGGIIKTYEYRMIPYILAENPTIKRKDAFKLSKQMMKGNKWKTFILDLSFFGWNFLSVLTFGILSIFFVNPYNAATFAELYVTLKEEKNITIYS